MESWSLRFFIFSKEKESLIWNFFSVFESYKVTFYFLVPVAAGTVLVTDYYIDNLNDTSWLCGLLWFWAFKNKLI